MALIEKAETGKVWLLQWLANRQQVAVLLSNCVTGTLATSKDTVQDGGYGAVDPVGREVVELY